MVDALYYIYFYGCLANLAFWPAYGFYLKNISNNPSDKKDGGIMWIGVLFTPIWPIWIYLYIFKPFGRF